MPNEFWGIAGRSGLNVPAGPAAVGLWLLAVGALVGAFARSQPLRAAREMSRGQWLLFLALCVVSFLFSQLFPVMIPWDNPLLRAYPATAALALLSAAPYLLAGVALNVPAALLVGLIAGLGRALGQTGAPLDMMAVALAAGASSLMMRQNYAGRLFGLLRRPPLAGALGRLIIPIFTALLIFTETIPAAGFYGALDLALFFGLWSALPAAVEGLVGGGLTSAGLWIAPQWRPDRGLVPSPFQRSLQRQLTAAFLTFAAVVVLLSVAVAFYFSARAAERALAEQMTLAVSAGAARLQARQANLSSTLARYGSDPALAAVNPSAKSAALGRLQADTSFSAIRLVDETGAVIATEATGGAPEADAELNPTERDLVASALDTGAARWGSEAPAMLLAVPANAGGENRAALLAGVAPEALADALEAIASDDGGRGQIVDEAGRVLLPAGSVADWVAPTAGQRSTRLSSGGSDVFIQRDAATGARQFVTYAAVPGSGWKVAATMPHAAVLRRTLAVIGPLALLLLAASGLFYVLVAALGRDITRPLAEVGRASRAIAGGGGLERPVRPQRDDEVGQLTLAFSQMQRALRQRLDELSLLLSVSNDVAATIRIDEGMAAVLQGVLRGTGAAGARAVVRNPNAPSPLIFAEGPAASSLSFLDRPLLLRLRSVDELAYGSAGEIAAGLDVDAGPAAALFALPLRPGGSFQGVLYLAYRQPHYFDSDERGLLRTLAGQATVLVQNAHLFAAAESGRRRLAAILASTTNGVIVTDPTDRVLLVNPAIERAFGLRAATVAGRPVLDALAAADPSGALAQRLSLAHPETGSQPGEGKLELQVAGRAYLASISTVYSSEGRTMGRVAVLQDVSDIREVDRMKSDFIAGISHDLLSPLTYMHNYAAMLPVVDDAALAGEYAEKIMGGIERMKRLVNDLLDLARIEAGLNLQFDRVRVGDLLAEVAQEYASPAHVAGVRLVVGATDNLPPIVADPTLLRRAITNLVTNGLKYAPNSGPLTLEAARQGDQIIIRVADHGPGIAAADQAHLFEKFYRAQGLEYRAGGSGLGLAIVKSVADHHGGQVWCESTPGAGSAFYLALPIGGPDAAGQAYSSM
jgi:PAS domain S-box-containing protein